MAVTGLATAHPTPQDVPLERMSLAEAPVEDPSDDAFDDAGSITLEHGEATIDATRGVRLYTQWWRPCVVPFAAVVVVHGLKDHSARYGLLAERLVAHGFAVHAFDLRGHARSSGARAWVDHFDDYVGDLEAVVARTREREEGAPVFVFGQGMGGAIAAQWAIARRPRLAGLVLSGASLQATDVPVEARSTRLLAALAPRARIFQVDVRRLSRDRATVEDLLRDTLVQHAPAPARTARELLDAMATIDARAGELAAPLLAMHGSADVASDARGSRRLVERAASADKRLYLYDGLAHDLAHEPERGRVARDLASWLLERVGT